MNFKMEYNHPIQVEPILSNFIAFFVLILILSSVGLAWYPSVEALTERIAGENSAPTSFNFFGIFALLMTSVVALYKGAEIDPDSKVVSYLSIYPSNFSLGIGSVGSAILLSVGLSILLVRQEMYALVFVLAGCYVGLVTWVLGLMLQHLVRPIESHSIPQRGLACISIGAFGGLFALELFNIPGKLQGYVAGLF